MSVTFEVLRVRIVLVKTYALARGEQPGTQEVKNLVINVLPKRQREIKNRARTKVGGDRFLKYLLNQSFISSGRLATHFIVGRIQHRTVTGTALGGFDKIQMRVLVYAQCPQGFSIFLHAPDASSGVDSPFAVNMARECGMRRSVLRTKHGDHLDTLVLLQQCLDRAAARQHYVVRVWRKEDMRLSILRRVTNGPLIKLL